MSRPPFVFLDQIARGGTPGPVGPIGPGGRVTTSAANSGATYTVTAPEHAETRLKLTLTANATLALAGGTPGEVCAVQLHLIQDATGSRTVTWPSNVDWGVNGPPVLSTATGKTDLVYLSTDDGGSSWQGALIGNGYSSPVPPSAPTSLGATVVSGDVQLDWTQGAANGSAITNNRIYRGTSSGSLTLLASIAAGTTYTDTTPLTDGTTYYYKVAAVNALGEGAKSAEISAVPGLVAVASDTFNRADAAATGASDGLIGQATPVGAKTWLNLLGSGTWSVASNKAVANGAARKAGVNVGVADCTVAVDIAHTGAAADHGIIFRWFDANNYCKAIVDPGGYYIQKVIGGTETNVANGGGALGADLTVRLSVVLSGTSVTIKANGTTVASGTISDAAVLSGTKHGILTGGGGAVTFDNFTVTTP